MKSKTNERCGRIQLGRVSTATLGSLFRTIEQVGLYGATAGISDR